MARACRLVLRDGRTLAWREFGALREEGFPVVFLHGNLNSREFSASWAATDAHAKAAEAHVLALDRPGYGASSAHAGRGYRDFAGDVRELVEHLGLRRFALVGFSSGGPHALACAAADHGGRVACLGLVSSDGPYDAMGGAFRRSMFGLEDGEAMTMDTALTRARANSAAMRASYEGMRDAAKRQIALRDIDTATAQGLEGAASDTVLEAAPWGFPVGGAGFSVPTHLWHGATPGCPRRRLLGSHLFFADLMPRAALAMSGAACPSVPVTPTGWPAKGVILAYPLAWFAPRARPPTRVPGTDDDSVPLAAGRHLADALGLRDGETAHFIRGENHTLIRRRWQVILETVVRAARADAHVADARL